MKKAELIKLLKFFNNYYQKKFEYPKPSTEDNKMLQETWMMFLEEYDYKKEITTAVKKLVIEKEWPPTPGQIIQEIEKMKIPEEEKISGQEAWGRVIQLVKRYGVQYGREKILENITETSEKAIEAVGGLRTIGMSDENDTFLMNSFVRAYECIQERNKEKQMLPGRLQQDISRLEQNDYKQLIAKEQGEE